MYTFLASTPRWWLGLSVLSTFLYKHISKIIFTLLSSLPQSCGWRLPLPEPPVFSCCLYSPTQSTTVRWHSKHSHRRPECERCQTNDEDCICKGYPLLQLRHLWPTEEPPGILYYLVIESFEATPLSHDPSWRYWPHIAERQQKDSTTLQHPQKHPKELTKLSKTSAVSPYAPATTASLCTLYPGPT